MAGSSIRSGPEIVKEFIESLEKDKSFDRGTVESIRLLYAQEKLTQIKLQQALGVKRKEAQEHG